MQYAPVCNVQMDRKSTVCSARFTVLQTKNSRRSTSAVTMENTDDSHREAIVLVTAN